MSYSLIEYYGDRESILIDNDVQDYNDYVILDRVRKFSTFGSMAYSAEECYGDGVEWLPGNPQYFSTEELANYCVSKWDAVYAREKNPYLEGYERVTHVKMIMMDIEFQKTYPLPFTKK